MHTYLLSETTGLNTSITFVPETMETRAPFVAFKTLIRLLARGIRLPDDDI